MKSHNTQPNDMQSNYIQIFCMTISLNCEGSKHVGLVYRYRRVSENNGVHFAVLSIV
jgi:hypothetical protein